ncbi:MAG: DUF2769 domain-containing protein [Candidatus Bathyarchaeum sp.]|nr:MAG: DUF2769 domain-containing protein [Candidatus Bathyarchaeum sp.]
MDKFEQMMQMMSQMTEEERMKAMEANKALCTCPGCPTYNECAQKKGELFYCAMGASPTCITEELGCICPACPITEKMGLTHEYFCVKGTEREQRGM